MRDRQGMSTAVFLNDPLIYIAVYIMYNEKITFLANEKESC